MLPTQGESIFEAILAALMPLVGLLHVLSIILRLGNRTQAKQPRKNIDPPSGAR